MADMTEEEVFLESQKATAEAESMQYESEAANEKQTESTSSDEYDPAKAVPDTFSPPAQNPSLSPGAVKQSQSLQPFDLSVNGNFEATGQQDQAGHEDDGRSQSRSMSGSSSSSSPPVNIQTNNVSSNANVSAKHVVEEEPVVKQAAGAESVDQASLSPALRSPTSDPNNAATAIQSQVDAPVHNSTEAVPNGDSSAMAQPSAPAPDSGPEAPSKTAAALQEPETKASILPKARLPHDKIGILEDRIQEDPRGDMDAWLSLIGEYRTRGKFPEACATYERFFLVFPAAAEQWVAYARMETEQNNLSAVERIFQKVLLSLPNLQLWSLYLDHVRRLNDVMRDTSGNTRQTITAAYELALDHIGMDKDSGKLWQEYISFLKSRPGNAGGSTWQEQQKMDQLRKAYQRAIKVPTQATQLLWKEYDQFEMGVNKLTGRKFLQEESPAYMSARSSYTALSNITRSLRRTTLPRLPPALGFDGEQEYSEQLEIWKRWIQWEKDDPLVLNEEGKPDEQKQWRDRVVFVYKQAVMDMRFWPELWFDAAQFCFQNDMEPVGKEFLVQGINANPESCLLAFKLADRIELTTTNEEGDDGMARRGAAVREPYDKVLGALYDLTSKTTLRESQAIARIESEFKEQSHELRNNNDADDEMDNEDDNDSKEKRRSTQIEAVKGIAAMQIQLLSKTITSVWMALMRAMRRVQGKGVINGKVGGSRQIFAHARNRGRLTHDIYVASALIEYHCYDPEAARRIFERGLKLFPEDEVFALEYIRHLTMTNDHTNARVIFETVVNKLTAKAETLARAKPLYAFFHDFESKYGELSQITKLEKRMKDHFPEDPTLSHFSSRFVQPGFDPTAIRPIISPATQTKPKAGPTSANVPAGGSPPSRDGYVNDSPKRPLPFEDDEDDGDRPRKFARAESPLKGAAGRRLEQQKRGQPLQGTPQPDHVLPQQPPPLLPIAITKLLSDLPRAATYLAACPPFNPEKTLNEVRKMDLRNARRAGSDGNSQQQRAPLAMPPRPLQPMPPQASHGPAYALPQHTPSIPQVPHYSGGYPSFSPNQPAASYTPPHQVSMPPSHPNFPSTNGQMGGYGGPGQAPGYLYGQGGLPQYQRY
ncbi:MAG: hypothetical protein Q9174_002339 [Haloplaca sp. 1 TL-2023]